MIGQQFGRWTVISKADINRKFPHWNCRCQCGTERAVQQANLRNGTSKSCGCLSKEISSGPHKHGHAHNGKLSKEYRAWMAMKSRCLYRSQKSFARYGGRGVTVCTSWIESFDNFLADVGLAPSEDYTIGRKNNDGNYEPGNVEWQTRNVQSRNTCYNRFLTHDGKTMVISDWAKKIGIDRRTIYSRLMRGHSVADALTTPLRSKQH